MVGLSAPWMPIVVSAVFVFIALSIIHGMLGWHRGDMTAVLGEAKVMETLRGLNVRPGDYRFPYSNSTDEMKTPEFAGKMKQGPVGIMSIRPNGDINMGNGSSIRSSSPCSPHTSRAARADWARRTSKCSA